MKTKPIFAFFLALSFGLFCLARIDPADQTGPNPTISEESDFYCSSRGFGCD